MLQLSDNRLPVSLTYNEFTGVSACLVLNSFLTLSPIGIQSNMWRACQVTTLTNYSGLLIPLAGLLRRTVTSSEAMNVLKPFYRAVHPDFFGKYPQQKVVNEESLKHLNSYIECSGRSSNQLEPGTSNANLSLQFFLHPTMYNTPAKTSTSSPLPKPVTIHLHGDNLKASLQSILTTCDMEEHVDSHTKEKLMSPSVAETVLTENNTDLPPRNYCYFDEDGDFFGQERWDVKDSRKPLQFSSWLRSVTKEAGSLRSASRPARKAIRKLTDELCKEFGCSQVNISCEWSPAVSLGTLKRLSEVFQSINSELLPLLLRETTVHLSDWNGVTVTGELHFDCNSLQKEWTKFLPRASVAKQMLSNFKTQEEFISKALGAIRIERHPLMSISSYWIALKRLRSCFGAKHSFREQSMNEHALMIIPPGMAASIKSDGAFLIPADMSQFQIARFVSSEERRAAKIREVHERSVNELHEILNEIKEQLKLRSLIVSDLLTKDEINSFCNSIELSLSGGLWEDGIESSDLYSLLGHHVKIDQVRGLSPEGIIHLPWDFR